MKITSHSKNNVDVLKIFQKVDGEDLKKWFPGVVLVPNAFESHNWFDEWFFRKFLLLQNYVEYISVYIQLDIVFNRRSRAFLMSFLERQYAFSIHFLGQKLINAESCDLFPSYFIEWDSLKNDF